MTFTLSKDTPIEQVINGIMTDFTNITDIACIYVDIKGKEKSYKYNFTDFCKFVRRIPQFRRRCNQCDMCGGLESFKNHICSPYRCHAGLIDFAVPIVYNDQLNGFICSGQMSTNDQRIPSLGLTTDISQIDELNHHYRNVPTYRYEEILSATRILNTLTTHYFPFSGTDTPSVFPVSPMLEEGQPPVITRTEIQKALQYIHENLKRSISLREIADHVFLSESYLSKLFKQEMNMNLVQYINQCRIIQAKNMLETSKLSIDAISKNLGYHRTSYFCKIFKQFTAETPHSYRQKHG